MAKVVVEFDTVSKALSVQMDGNPVQDVVAVRLGQKWDDEEEYYCELTQREINKDEGMVKYTSTIAGQQSPADEESKLVQQDVNAFFGD